MGCWLRMQLEHVFVTGISFAASFSSPVAMPHVAYAPHQRATASIRDSSRNSTKQISTALAVLQWGTGESRVGKGLGKVGLSSALCTCIPASILAHPFQGTD